MPQDYPPNLPSSARRALQAATTRWNLRRFSLSTKLTLALSSAAVLLLTALGAWQLSAEEDDLRISFERDLQLLGRSLQVAFENALRDRQAEDVEETLRELERIEPGVDIYVYGRRGEAIAASRGALPRLQRTASQLDIVRYRDDAEPPSAELSLPLRVGDGEAARLVLVRPTVGMKADLRATRRRILLSVAGLVILVTAITMALSRFWVGAPLARMIAHIQRVRAGDLSPSKPESRTDEVGATLQEFEALVQDLAEARQKLEIEAEARRRLELALREMDKLATIGQLAAGLAHEIGSPLQILEGRIGSLEAKSDDPAETRRLARILREQAQRITRIVQRLLGIARRRPVPPRTFDAVPPLRSVVELLEGEARRRRVRLSSSVADDLPALHGHADSVQQIVLNLLRNALDATEPEGNIELTMRRAILVGPDGRAITAVRVVVSDTGRGMDQETLERAFDPFFTTRSPTGTGMGLAVVKGIVDEHQGRVSVDSEVGRGTTFVVDLPARAADEEGIAYDAT
jgi:signal transduction histidine kinase